MEVGILIAVFVGLGGLALVLRLLAGSFDGDRVEQYIRENGWELVERSWSPFGPGWVGEKDSRIYRIVYRDQEGNLHRAHVKTSMLSGVYLTNDCIVEDAPEQTKPDVDALAAENERLRERIRELEQGRM